MLHETSRLLADKFDVEPSAVIAVSLQFDLDVNYISVNFIFDQLSVVKIRHSMCSHLQDFGQIDTSRTDIINYCPENLRHRWVQKTFTSIIIIIPIIFLISMKMIQAMQSWSLPRAGRPMQQLGAAALGSCQGRTP